MKLSIVIPLYNKEKYFSRCLDSLLEQDLTQSEYEIIVIDDGSSDSSGLIAKEYAKKHDNVLFFSQKNQGISATRNRGLDIARGTYVYFLDADDYIASNILKYLLELCEYNNLDILTFKTKYVKEGLSVESIPPKDLFSEIEVLEGIDYIAKNSYRNEVWWYFVKKSFLVETTIRFIQSRLLEDAIFTPDLFLKAKRVAHAHIDVHRFVKVENSIQTSTSSKHLIKFIHDLVFAIEELGVLINGLDRSKANYTKVVQDLKKKQQSFVFTLFIKTYRCKHLSFKDLNKILKKLGNLKVYPIKRQIGGIGNSNTKQLYSKLYVPIFNNKILLFSSLLFKRLFIAS